MTLSRLKFDWLNILNILSVLLIIVAASLWLFDLSLAQEGSSDEDEEPPLKADYVVCAEKLLPMIMEEEGVLVEYVQEAFLQEKWNTEIIEEVNAVVDDAFGRIQAERDRIIQEELKPLGYKYEDLSSEDLNCTLLVSMHERTIRNLIMSHSTKTASAKSSYVLVSKLQEINDGLREMNRGFGDIYAGFQALSDKLPGVTE